MPSVIQFWRTVLCSQHFARKHCPACNMLLHSTGTSSFWTENIDNTYFMHITTHNINSGTTQILFENMSDYKHLQNPYFYIYIWSCHNLFWHCICVLDLLILCSFVLISPWGYWFIAETCSRAHVQGWDLIAYKLCAFVGVCGRLQHPCSVPWRQYASMMLLT